jgi:hypothetical protein
MLVNKNEHVLYLHPTGQYRLRLFPEGLRRVVVFGFLFFSVFFSLWVFVPCVFFFAARQVALGCLMFRSINFTNRFRATVHAHSTIRFNAKCAKCSRKERKGKCAV